MNHSREPIKHTCPDINKYINWIKCAIIKDRELERLDESNLLDAASSMASQLEDCIGYLEELRSSNHILREWGISEADEVDRLNEELRTMELKLPI